MSLQEKQGIGRCDGLFAIHRPQFRVPDVKREEQHGIADETNRNSSFPSPAPTYPQTQAQADRPHKAFPAPAGIAVRFPAQAVLQNMAPLRVGGATVALSPGCMGRQTRK